jgi:tetratricopeptide (TPR) repeat protein
MATVENSSQSGAKPAGRRRRILTFLLAVIVVTGAAAVSWYVWDRMSAPALAPFTFGEGAEPAVIKAVEKAHAAVRLHPRSAAAWGELGQIMSGNGYADEADTYFAQAEQLDPREPRWPYLRGWRVAVRDRDAAIPHLRRAIELCDVRDRQNTTPRLLLAEVYLERNEWDEVETLCGEVLKQQPDNPRAHYGLAMTALGRNDLETSVSHLLRAAESPLAQQRASAQLAAVYRRLGNAAAADDYGRRTARMPLDPPYPDPYVEECRHLAAGRQDRFLEAERLNAQGRFPEATRLLREIAEQFPDARSYDALGRTLLKTRDFDGAERYLRAALALEPNIATTHYSLSVALFRQAEDLRDENADAAKAKYEAAVEAARQATVLKADHAMAYYQLGLILGRLGRRGEAIDALRKGALCRPEAAEIHLALGETLAEDGQTEEALEELQRAHQLAPGDPRPGKVMDALRSAAKKP